VSDELAPRRERERRPRVREFRRFRWITAGLFLLGAVVLIAAAALSSPSSRGGSGDGSWSAWSPPDGGATGAQEIADFVAPYYRATPAQQLAVVTTVSLDSGSDPLQVAIPANGTSGELEPLQASSTIVYNLCGIGTSDCAIGAGTASNDRLLLLRREALELALYTFKYISGIQTVVAILPPGHTVVGCTGICAKPQESRVTKALDVAVAFVRSELQPELSRPLKDTLPEPVPPTVSQMPAAPEAELVSVITAHGLFSEHVEQAQDGSTVIALDPMPPQ
jgi:hypothetical protein